MDRIVESGLRVEKSGGIAWLTLDRPDVSNALNPALARDLLNFFADAEGDCECRVIIVQGAGRNFCAGFDLNHVGEITSGFEESMRLQRLMSGLIAVMRRCPQPIIALLHGAACGAGFALALAADVRYATADMRMNVAMARIGLTGCDMGISYFLPRIVGSSIAAELMMTGRFIEADRAERTGLISGVVERGALRQTGEALAADMLNMSDSGLRLTKEGLNGSLAAANLEEVLLLEDRGQVICINQHMSEGVAAFRGKRPPNYRKNVAHEKM